MLALLQRIPSFKTHNVASGDNPMTGVRIAGSGVPAPKPVKDFKSGGISSAGRRIVLSGTPEQRIHSVTGKALAGAGGTDKKPETSNPSLHPITQQPLAGTAVHAVLLPTSQSSMVAKGGVPFSNDALNTAAIGTMGTKGNFLTLHPLWVGLGLIAVVGTYFFVRK